MASYGKRTDLGMSAHILLANSYGMTALQMAAAHGELPLLLSLLQNDLLPLPAYQTWGFDFGGCIRLADFDKEATPMVPFMWLRVDGVEDFAQQLTTDHVRARLCRVDADKGVTCSAVVFREVELAIKPKTVLEFGEMSVELGDMVTLETSSFTAVPIDFVGKVHYPTYVDPDPQVACLLVQAVLPWLPRNNSLWPLSFRTSAFAALCVGRRKGQPNDVWCYILSFLDRDSFCGCCAPCVFMASDQIWYDAVEEAELGIEAQAADGAEYFTNDVEFTSQGAILAGIGN